MNTNFSTTDEVIDAIRLSRKKGVGAARFRDLIRAHGSIRRALDLYSPTTIRYPNKADLDDQIEHTRAFLRSGGQGRIVERAGYPRSLLALGEPPPVLFVRGRTSWVDRPALAIVGARESDEEGLAMAARLAWLASDAGLVVVSGGAHGIDAAAHLAAIECGTTVAVAATGVDVAFPADHASLFERVANTGAVVSELLPGTLPRKSFFPTRNRIIAALASAVVVVRGTSKSGALITAKWALRLDRPLAAFESQGSLGGAARALRGRATPLDSIESARIWITQVAARLHEANGVLS